MAATVKVNEWNGASGTKTDKTSGTIRFKNADNATVDLNNPLVVPSADREYSYEKWLRLAAYGEYTQISNLRAYTDGANGLQAGSPLAVKGWYGTRGGYQTPAIPSESDDPPKSAGAGSPLEVMSDLFAAVSGSPIDLDAVNTGPFTPLSPNSDEQDIGDFLVLVCEVEVGATNGLLTAETLTFAWDEI